MKWQCVFIVAALLVFSRASFAVELARGEFEAASGKMHTLILETEDTRIKKVPVNKILSLRFVVSSAKMQPAVAHPAASEASEATETAAGPVLEQAMQAPSELAGLEVYGFDAMMPEHLHGMVVKPRVSKVPPIEWKVEGVKLHMPGLWRVIFSVKTEAMSKGKDFTFDMNI